MALRLLGFPVTEADFTPMASPGPDFSDELTGFEPVDSPCVAFHQMRQEKMLGHGVHRVEKSRLRAGHSL